MMDTKPEGHIANKPDRSGTDPVLPKLGFFGGLRWLWRQLTSMRTALFLLLILAVAAVPGSIFPQRSIDAARTAQYLQDHSTVGPWLDRLGFFDVFKSPWFAAIYLLLIVSLLGCVIPRIRVHWRVLRSPIPAVPRRLERLPGHADATVAASVDETLDAARAVLRGKRYRIREDDVADGAPKTLAAEGGRLRETGNLSFHLCLVIVIISVAMGHLLGWRGDVIVPVGQSFSSTAGNYDTFTSGPWVDPSALKPFSLDLKALDVTFESNVSPSSAQWGQPRNFDASVTETVDGSTTNKRIGVNDPLSVGGSSVYLLGNGYAPVITVRDAKGNILYRQATPFLPQDNMYKSVGAIKVTGASPKQLGFAGFFLPTAAFSQTQGPVSTFPALINPALVLTMYEGNLFPGNTPQSVYTLNVAQMKQLTGSDGEPLRIELQPGKPYTLPNGLGTISLDSMPRWAGLSVRHDPGKIPALIGALLGLAGLIMSMTLRRRRIFIKVQPAPPGDDEARRTLVTIGGLAKGEDPRLQVALENLLESIVTRTGKA